MDSFVIVLIGVLILVCLGFIFYLHNKKNNHLKIKEKSDYLPKKVTSEQNFNSGKRLSKKEKTHLNKITEIVLQNGLGQELIFTRPDKLSSVKYQEINFGEHNKISGHLFQGALPVIGQAMYLKDIAKKAPNGLFTTKATPSTLSNFADGSFSTMVRDSSNNLVGHEGFTRVNLSGTNPLLGINVAMQATAAISGQYYLHQIYSQLDIISSNLEQLMNMHHDEKVGVLLNAKVRLSEITSRQIVDEVDINEIRSLRNSIGEIYQEYKNRLDREQQEISKFRSKALRVEERVKEYNNAIEGMNFTLQIAFEADRLTMQAELAEIAVRMKRDYKDSMLEELFFQLNKNYKNSFSISIKDNIESIFIPINKNANNIIGNGKDFWLIDRDPRKLLRSIQNKSELLQEKLMEKNNYTLFNQVLSEPNKEQNILILPEENLQEQRIFIPLNE
ncbi:MAG: hypothetical protein ABS913_08850 [Desemzia incerta]|uniref:hypothetical protein n=1 Tax=Desemzia incerta TaxID=82801 RepID=UPI0033164660